MLDVFPVVDGVQVEFSAEMFVLDVSLGITPGAQFGLELEWSASSVVFSGTVRLLEEGSICCPEVWWGLRNHWPQV